MITALLVFILIFVALVLTFVFSLVSVIIGIVFKGVTFGFRLFLKPILLAVLALLFLFVVIL